MTYINTAEGGVVASSWTGIAGAELVGAERLIYGGDTAPDQWSLLENPGVPEAPSDGETYARSDEEWVAIESFPEAPQDGDIYGRSDADWVAIEGFPEAPQDGDIYGRSDADWVAIEGFQKLRKTVRLTEGLTGMGCFHRALLSVKLHQLIQRRVNSGGPILMCRMVAVDFISIPAKNGSTLPRLGWR